MEEKDKSLRHFFLGLQLFVVSRLQFNSVNAKIQWSFDYPLRLYPPGMSWRKTGLGPIKFENFLLLAQSNLDFTEILLAAVTSGNHTRCMISGFFNPKLVDFIVPTSFPSMYHLNNIWEYLTFIFILFSTSTLSNLLLISH